MYQDSIVILFLKMSTVRSAFDFNDYLTQRISLYPYVQIKTTGESSLRKEATISSNP